MVSSLFSTVPKFDGSCIGEITVGFSKDKGLNGFTIAGGWVTILIAAGEGVVGLCQCLIGGGGGGGGGIETTGGCGGGGGGIDTMGGGGGGGDGTETVGGGGGGGDGKETDPVC